MTVDANASAGLRVGLTCQSANRQPGRFQRAGLFLAFAAALAACATPPSARDSGSAFAGRLSVLVAASDAGPARGVSGEFALRGQAQAGSFEMAGPLGMAAVKATWSAGRYRLESGQQTTEFSSLEDMSQAGLGEPLPLAALFDWLRGRPWPEAPSVGLVGSRAGFEQLGWRIETADLAQGRLRAQRLQAPSITLRVQLDTLASP